MLRNALLGLALCLAAGTVIAAAPIPLEAFFTYSKISATKISPDGKYLAMAVANEKTGLEKNMIAIIGIGDHKVTANFSLKGDQSVLDFWWATDKRLLVATATHTGSLDRPQGDGELYAVNVDGTQKMPLLPYMPSSSAGAKHGPVQTIVYFGDVLYIDHDKVSPEILFQGYTDEGSLYEQTPKAYSLNIYTGELREVAHGAEASGSLMADQNGVVRLTWGVDAKGAPHLFYRPNSETLDWKDLSALFASDDAAFGQSVPLGFAADNKHFYWLGRSKDSTLGLYLVDPETMNVQPLYEDPEFDIQDEVWSFWGGKGTSIIAVDTMPGLPQVHILDPDDPKAQYLASLYQAFEGQRVRITSETRDHKQMVVFTSSDKDVGEFYLFDSGTGKVSFLFAGKPDLDPKQLADMQPVTFQARDGLTIRGYLTLPPGSDGKNLPMIVNPHGGPHGPRDEWGFDSEVQLFASRGYAVLQINFRGSGGYGLKFQQLGYRHWSSTMQDDLADGLQWAVKQGYADPGRVCIYGASYGGYAAFENPIRYPGLYKCAVGYVGAYDLTLLGHKGDISHFAGGSRAIDEFLGSDMEERKRESPAYNAGKLKLPLFIIYGGEDQRVIPENATNMMSALDKAGIKYDPPMYEPNEGHGFVKQEHNFELYKRMLAFFDKYIGPDAPKN